MVGDDVQVYRAVLPTGILPVEVTSKSSYYEARSREISPVAGAVGNTPVLAVRRLCEHNGLDPAEILAPGMESRAEMTARIAALEARVAELESLYRSAHERGTQAMREAVLTETSDDGWGEHINNPKRDNEIQQAVRRLRVPHDPPPGVTRGR